MAKHFENGGCGIRPFVDLCILDDLPNSDVAKRNALLEKGNLLKFANVARKLSRAWFVAEDYDLISHQMEDLSMRCRKYSFLTMLLSFITLFCRNTDGCSLLWRFADGVNSYYAVI